MCGVKTSDFPIPATWDQDGLEAIGFQGFVPLANLQLKTVPTGHGIYVVLRPDLGRPHEFLEDNPVKKVGIAIYSRSDLEKRWLPDAEVVYIGKAMGAKGLQDRLRPYSKKNNSHSGGRAIW